MLTPKGGRKAEEHKVHGERERHQGENAASSGHSPALADRCGKKVGDLGIYTGAAVPDKERKFRALLSSPHMEVSSSCSFPWWEEG